MKWKQPRSASSHSVDLCGNRSHSRVCVCVCVCVFLGDHRKSVCLRSRSDIFLSVVETELWRHFNPKQTLKCREKLHLSHTCLIEFSPDVSIVASIITWWIDLKSNDTAHAWWSLLTFFPHVNTLLMLKTVHVQINLLISSNNRSNESRWKL